MNVLERINFTEVIRELDYQGLLNDHTIIITDFDNTLISYAEEAKSLLELQPEKIPDEVLTQVKKIVDSGARLAIATNRPKEGFAIAEAMSNVMGNYPVFPQSLEDMGVEVFGGGPLFMVEKYKRTDNAIYAIKSWLLAAEKDGGAGVLQEDKWTVICIGDRPWDLQFFDKLEESIKAYNADVEVLMYKIPGFKVEDNHPRGWWNTVLRFFLKFLP